MKAVDGVSLDLQAGETLGIVGESGCGKSTLGRAILRLIKPTAGNVVWLGRDLARPGRRRRCAKSARDMQIIFQDPLASLDPRMTVGQIIARPLKTFEPGLGKAETERAGHGRDARGRPGAGDAPAATRTNSPAASASASASPAP